VRAGAVVPAVALAAVLSLPVGAAADVRTGQSPDCKRFCMSVEPREGPEGSVFRITGRGWRPSRRVSVIYGVYCRPDQPCIEIAYFARLRTNSRGGFTFRVRAGQPRPNDRERRIFAGSGFTFSQWVGKPSDRRVVRRRPRYRLVLP
jgi:hypothetical protein